MLQEPKNKAWFWTIQILRTSAGGLLWKHLAVLNKLPVAEAFADAHMKFSRAHQNSSHVPAGDERDLGSC